MRTVPEIIESRGFRSETFNITTPDGYILTMFRVVNQFMKRNKADTYPVLLAHGAALDSTMWLINSDDGHLAPKRDMDGMSGSTSNGTSGAAGSKKKADKRPKQKATNNLAFLLANEGYDVWLLNFRGSKYSRSHRRMTPSDPKYWDFSNDELIQQDLPSCVDFILEHTGYETLGYVGHSLGAAAMFALLTHQPDMNQRIKPFIALAPPVNMSRLLQHIVLPFVKVRIPIPRLIANPILRLLDTGLQATSPGRVKSLAWYSRLVAYISSGNMFQYHLSRGLQAALSQFYVHSDINYDRLSVYASQADYWMSRKQLSHILQQVIYKEFSRFDYGDNQNKLVYGDADPPLYDIRDITNQFIAIFYAKADAITSADDVEDLTSTLKVPLLLEHRVKDNDFSHLDFAFSNKLATLVNPEILKTLNRVKGSRASPSTSAAAATHVAGESSVVTPL